MYSSNNGYSSSKTVKGKYILMVLSVRVKAGYLSIKLHFDTSSFLLKLFNTAENRHFVSVSIIIHFYLGKFGPTKYIHES